MSWQQIRIPCCGPIDEDTARPFVALGAAVPVAHGVHWRRGAVRPWGTALSSVSDVDPASRRFGEVLVHYAGADNAERHTVSGVTRNTYAPGCVARVIDARRVLSGVASPGDGGRFDCCETANWIVSAYWTTEKLHLRAAHKSTGYVIERRDIPLVTSGLVWPWPRVLRDMTGDDRIVVVYAQTDVEAVAPQLSDALWHYARYSLSVATGFYAGDSYTRQISAVSKPTGGPEYTFHDARQLSPPYSFVASFIDDPDPPTERRVRTVVADSSFALADTTAAHSSYPAVALGAFQANNDAYIVVIRGDSGGNDNVRYVHSGGAYTTLASLPIPSTWSASVYTTAIGGSTGSGGTWRAVFDDGRIAGCSNISSPVLLRTAKWDGSWDHFAVPFFVRGAWHYQLRIGSHCIVASEYGAGHYTGGGEVPAKNAWRLIPVARVATWVATDSTLGCAYPRVFASAQSRCLVYVRTQVATDADADAYRIDFDAAATDWVQDTVKAAGVETACAGLLVVPDVLTSESGFVAGPRVVTQGSGTSSWNIALQWERIGRDGEIHRSAPTATTAYGVSGTYTVRVGAPLTRSTAPVRLLVWEADIGGVYRLRKRVDVDPLAEQTVITVIASSAVDGPVAPWYGQLMHGPAPSPWHACVHGSRTWVISAEHRSSLWPSLLMTDPLVAPVFSASLVLVAHDDILHRVYSTDVGVVALGEHGVYVVRGDGPDNTGAGGAHELQRVPGAPGCTGAACQSRWGVVYATSDGVVLLDRGLGVQRISDSLRESIAGESIYDAVWWPQRELVVLVTGTYLWLWNADRGWSRAIVTGANCARVDDSGRLEVIKGNDYAQVYDFLDANCDATTTSWSTAWVDGTIRPWLRARKVRLRARVLPGAISTSNEINVSVYMDGDDTAPVQTNTITLADMISDGDARYHTLRLGRQKCQTIRVEVSSGERIPLEWEWVEIEFLTRRGVAKIGGGSGLPG